MHPVMLTRLRYKRDVDGEIRRIYGHHHHQWFSTGLKMLGVGLVGFRSALAVDWLRLVAEACAYFPRSEAYR